LRMKNAAAPHDAFLSTLATLHAAKAAHKRRNSVALRRNTLKMLYLLVPGTSVDFTQIEASVPGAADDAPTTTPTAKRRSHPAPPLMHRLGEINGGHDKD
jgi:hypothetical protein